ncbi:short-chain dehydrogenase [Panaeolus papilionaceus]|nr:short-chain dehydrogenase [Panaeolus papilionaceus]
MSLASYRPQAINDLTGRIALVTGGGTGIGLMITKGLAAAGAKVYISGRRLEVLQKVATTLASDLGAEIIPFQMDVTDKDSIQKGKKLVEEKEGKLHILVNNAGQVGPTSPFLNNPDAPENKDAETMGTAMFNSESVEGWKDLYAINSASIFFVTTAFLGLLAKGSEDEVNNWSSIVNITSISGVIKVAQDHVPAASHITKMFATEIALKKIPIRVNAVAPGVYESEMTYDEITPEMVDNIGKGVVSTPARRAGTGEEMAGTVVYLVSKAGGFTNGQEIIIDGGYVAVNPAVV